MPRKDLSLNAKIKLLEQFKSQPPNTSCRQLEKITGVSKSTISRLLKDAHKLQEEWTNQQGPSRKRKREGKDPDVDEALNSWFSATKQRGINVSGPMLKLKAEELAKKLGREEFKATEGWFSRWKVRHDIQFKKAYGEKGSANIVEAEKWKIDKLPELLASFNPEDIFNADETGLFYRATPDGSLCYKHETLVGFKKAMDRVTVLCCANMNGNEKQKLLIIGKVAKPRCFKGIALNSLPVDYHSNKNAWMTADIFRKWLTEWDRQLQKTSRNILLLVDNCAAHPHLGDLKNIRLEFLPPNTTSVIQPMDMGVIRNLKFYYRKTLVNYILEKIEENALTATSNAKEVSSKVNILQAIQFVAKSWKNVSSETIRNCFNHCGFKSHDGEMQQLITLNDPVEESFPQFQHFDEFLDVDRNLECYNDWEDYDDEIVEEIAAKQRDSNHENEDSSDDDIPEHNYTISLPQARKNLEELKRFFMQIGNEDSPMEALDICADYVQNRPKYIRQHTLDSYFKPT